ncbi:MAG TPA: O-antigen ligase family protein, partial [Pirellulales bacterium]|nr:O-antigen ligase family protein [Pirellulales bacterium]
MSTVCLDKPAEVRVVAGSLAAPVGLTLLAACVLVNDANFRVAEIEEVSLDWQTALRLGLCALCGLYAAWNLAPATRALTRFPMAWLLLFAGWAWLTLPTAIAPLYATAACAALTSTALFAGALVERASGESIVKTIVTTILILAIGCWIAQFVRPELGQPDYLTPGHEPTGWRLGGLMHANGLGAHCALAIGLLCVGRATRQWSWRSIAPLAAFFAVTLLATGSRTSCLMLGAGLAVVPLRKTPGVLALAVAALATLVLVGEACGANWTDWLLTVTRDGNVQEITTFTGRTELWEMAIDHLRGAPLLGYG